MQFCIVLNGSALHNKFRFFFRNLGFFFRFANIFFNFNFTFMDKIFHLAFVWFNFCFVLSEIVKLKIKSKNLISKSVKEID